MSTMGRTRVAVIILNYNQADYTSECIGSLNESSFRDFTVVAVDNGSTDESDQRAMCRLEEQMISEALGQPVHLSSCRLDGDSCCQFSAVESNGKENNNE